MIRTLLLCAIVVQAGAQTAPKPVLENDRVIVWDVTGPVATQPFDAVVVSFSGTASFVPKGAPVKVEGRSIVIDLKDYLIPPAIENKTGFPPPFPRNGSRKILENGRVTIWDNTWTLGEATPVHFHDKDVVLVYLDDGEITSTALDGQVTVSQNKFGTVKFTLGNRAHTEMLTRGKLRAIITELK